MAGWLVHMVQEADEAKDIEYDEYIVIFQDDDAADMAEHIADAAPGWHVAGNYRLEDRINSLPTKRAMYVPVD